jgi:hypothetical protein
VSGVFPFGAPVIGCAADIPLAENRVVVLGAYPSALHVRWTPPQETNLRPIAALAVDNEPAPFWDGSDAEARVRAWETKHFDAEFGEIDVPMGLNGPSGAWVRDRVLEPLGIEQAFITDCLTTYRTSVDQARRIEDTYRPFALERDLPPAQISPHPGEDAILKEATSQQHERIRAQLLAARPEFLITLGNAAARTMAKLADNPTDGVLVADAYGQLRRLKIAELWTQWIPLAHPAAPKRWQDVHSTWVSARAGESL